MGFTSSREEETEKRWSRLRGDLRGGFERRCEGLHQLERHTRPHALTSSVHSLESSPTSAVTMGSDVKVIVIQR